MSSYGVNNLLFCISSVAHTHTHTHALMHTHTHTHTQLVWEQEWVDQLPSEIIEDRYEALFVVVSMVTEQARSVEGLCVVVKDR